MTRNLLIQEFLDEIEQRADAHFKGRQHQAFLSWYIEAEFGRAQWSFTDDVNDGGIDAIVWRPDEIPSVVIIQSKFTERVGRGLISQRAYRDLSELVQAFRYGGQVFDDWLGTVRDDLRRSYRKAFDCLNDLGHWSKGRRAFRLVTTSNGRLGDEFTAIPGENFVYGDTVLRLYEQYRKGATPKARPLHLTIDQKLSYPDKNRRVTSYLFNAKVSDYRMYLDKNDVGRLVARNIRYNLGGKVGRDIRRTYELAPLNFWYVHNGLTIVCDDLTEKNQVATLLNPSVVNGAQTLYAISASPKKHSTALVTTRVIVRGDHKDGSVEDDQWLQTVIRGVNTQNRVHSYDFRSNEPEQFELQSRFRDLKVFYERKRGEWREYRNEPSYRSFERVSLRTIGLILTATSEKSGQGVLLVKQRGVETIFDEKHYRKLFPTRAQVSRRFYRIYLAYRIFRLLQRFGYRSTKEFRKQRHAFWNTLWVLHAEITSVDALQHRCDVRRLRDIFDALEGNGAWGRHAKKILKQTRTAVWMAWRKSRSADPERLTPANFFKTKFGNRKVLTLAVPKIRRALRGLGQYIAQSL